MVDGAHLPVADDHVGPPGQHRRDQVGDGIPGVLAVGVGVDDDVGPQPQAGVDARLEGAGQPQVLRVADDVVDTVGRGHFGRGVMAAVVDDQRLDAINARHAPRQVGQRPRQHLGFVVAGNLDNEFHG